MKVFKNAKKLGGAPLQKCWSVANEACSGGRVSVNGKDVKPSYSLKIGDVVDIRFGEGSLKFKVLILKETVKKEEAQTLYEIIN